VNGNNTLEDEIIEIVAKGNKAFYENEAFLKANYCPENPNKSYIGQQLDQS
jgi:hypothetical protein